MAALWDISWFAVTSDFTSDQAIGDLIAAFAQVDAPPRGPTHLLRLATHSAMCTTAALALGRGLRELAPQRLAQGLPLRLTTPELDAWLAAHFHHESGPALRGRLASPETWRTP